MTKYRSLKNRKKSLKKMRNRIRRLGDYWYSKKWLYTQRRDAKKEIEDQRRNYE